ncbi:MAG: zinc ribbon domain-containing protein [Fidelibacterota bacterium]
MPIYEFKCRGCGDQFEELIFSHSGVSDVSCPRCGSSGVEKLISTFAFNSSGGSSQSSTSTSGCSSCSTTSCSTCKTR